MCYFVLLTRVTLAKCGVKPQLSFKNNLNFNMISHIANYGVVKSSSSYYFYTSDFRFFINCSYWSKKFKKIVTLSSLIKLEIIYIDLQC